MGVEFGAVYAYEFGFPADGDAAGSTHAGAVDHDGVERSQGGEVVFLGEEGDEFHHDGGAYRDTEIYFFALDDLFDTVGDKTFFAVGAVIGHDDDFVGIGAHLVFENDEFLGAGGQYRDDAVAGLFHRFDDGQQGGDAYAAAATDDGPYLLDVGGLSQRAYDIGDEVADFEGTQFAARFPDGLYDEGDGTPFGIGRSDGQRYAFAFFSDADNDEVPGFAGFGNERRFYVELHDVGREILFADDFVHVTSSVFILSCKGRQNY